jgi:lipopolysaccharide export system protein LptA
LNRKAAALIVLLLVTLSIFGDSISFAGGESSLTLREGQKSVTLSGGAEVSTGSITIMSDSMSLTGDDWRYVECTGNIVITDSERGLEIRTSTLWFDREAETIIISSWFEIDDTEQDLYATAGSLRYDMKDEKLELGMQVTLMRISDGEVMTCSSESLTYDRNNEFVSLRGKSRVEWKGDEYSADIISVDLKNDEISLSGRIRGTING